MYFVIQQNSLDCWDSIMETELWKRFVHLADFKAKHLFKVCRLADEEQIKGPAPAEVGHDDCIDGHGGEELPPGGLEFLSRQSENWLYGLHTAGVQEGQVQIASSPPLHPSAGRFHQCSPRYIAAPHHWWSGAPLGSHRTQRSRTCTILSRSILSSDSDTSVVIILEVLQDSVSVVVCQGFYVHTLYITYVLISVFMLFRFWLIF